MERELERRFNTFVILVIFIFATLFGRAGYLQLIRGRQYERLAEGNRIRVIPSQAPRGTIRDRHGVPIVDSRPAYTVSLVPNERGFDSAVLDRLAQIIGMTRAELDKLIKDRRGRPFEPIRIMSDITQEMHTRIEEASYELPGVVVDVQPVRNYIYGNLAAQVLGYVREISDSQLKSLQDRGISDYKMGDIYGQMGIENRLDKYLRGLAGGRQVEVDSYGRPQRTIGEEKPLAGADVYLTLDLNIQQAAERALDASLARLQAQGRPARSGAVIAEDPRTGEILAMASRPGFDPNVFNGILTPELYNQLFKDPYNPFNNRGLTGTFAPGSTFKMVVATAALQEGLVTPTETVTCTGTYFTIAPKKCTGVHGKQNIVQAIQNSCNIFFYEMGRRLGPDKIAKYAIQYGFGQASGIDLSGERAGILPSTAWKQQQAASGQFSDGRWWPAETLDMAIGQGFNAFTPLQLINYVATVANGGQHRQPYVVKEVRDISGSVTGTAAPATTGNGPRGTVVLQNSPKLLNTVDVSPENLAIIQQGMFQVAHQGTGSALFRTFPIPVAAKTGTAETGKSKEMNNGWFVAYAPFNDPQIVVTVIVEAGGTGAGSGASVAKAIFEEYFKAELTAQGYFAKPQAPVTPTTPTTPTPPTPPATPPVDGTTPPADGTLPPPGETTEPPVGPPNP